MTDPDDLTLRMLGYRNALMEVLIKLKLTTGKLNLAYELERMRYLSLAWAKAIEEGKRRG